ncbi:MAG TPA: VOC family protein [Puia sp.]|nr:VOC family protein [Puia sp.]
MTPYPTVIPMIAYENGVQTMEWLCNAFGFTERTRWLDDAGRLTHGELTLGDGVIILASPTPDYQSPSHHRQHCEAAAAWSLVPYIIDGVLVYVQDIRSHFDNAVAAGARILSAIETGGPGMRYRAEDPEGHRWMFMQR